MGSPRISPEAVQGLAKPFFEQYPGQAIFVSGCCGRIFVGVIAASKCSTCPKQPATHQVSNTEEIPGVVDLIQQSWDTP